MNLPPHDQPSTDGTPQRRPARNTVENLAAAMREGVPEGGKKECTGALLRKGGGSGGGDAYVGPVYVGKARWKYVAPLPPERSEYFCDWCGHRCGR